MNDKEQALQRLRDSRESSRKDWVEAGYQYALNQAEFEELERAKLMVETPDLEDMSNAADVLHYVVTGKREGHRDDCARLAERMTDTETPSGFFVAAFLEGMVDVLDEV